MPGSCIVKNCCPAGAGTRRTAQDIKDGRVEALRAQRFGTDDRLMKTLFIAPGSAGRGVACPHAQPLAALNHGTVRSPIPGQESQIVLQKCRNWAAQVGEVKITDDGANPVISLITWSEWTPRGFWPTPRASTAMATGYRSCVCPALRPTRPDAGRVG